MHIPKKGFSKAVAAFGLIWTGLCTWGYSQCAPATTEISCTVNSQTQELEVAAATKCPGMTFPTGIYNALEWVVRDNYGYVRSLDSGVVAKIGIYPNCTPDFKFVRIPEAHQMIVDSSHPWLYIDAGPRIGLVIIDTASMTLYPLDTGVGATDLAIDGSTLLIAGRSGIAYLDLNELYAYENKAPDLRELQSKIKALPQQGSFGPWSRKDYTRVTTDAVAVLNRTTKTFLLPTLNPNSLTFAPPAKGQEAKPQELTISNPYPVVLIGLIIDNGGIGSFKDNDNCSPLDPSANCVLAISPPAPVKDRDQYGTIVIKVPVNEAGALKQEQLSASVCLQREEGKSQCKTTAPYKPAK